ncbi:M56 family metallopeptidase [Protofrankia symbiont of Coriaria ruscifolia]|uniref:Peptidase M48 Ste24p n=1 Tax=Candidatus Protofrankia californiensis TaxID=1839754 RepID=A0A1C3PDR0_9ACTN|nr:M56 family metallopeptidase [Protofrankia symbiont of Coriaria ruscifolia]SBW27947.1 peptidase M48 Ste24p [Candidatus Protofrankia californiensis]
MTAVALTPFVSSLLLALGGGWLGRRLPPAAATRLLTAACLVTALATGFILSVAAFTLLAPMPVLAAVGHWSATVVRGRDPLPAPAGLVPAAVVAGLLAAATRRAVAVGRDLAAAELTCRRLGPAPTGLVIVDDDHPDAYTLPGLTGRIVVSTAMLRALPADERRILLAHEHSHLRHRHHAYTQLADLAAAANPLLRTSAAAVRRAVERWADEDAAVTADNRAVAVRALARAGLARAGTGAIPTAALGAVHTDLAHRARALREPPPKPRPVLALTLAALILATAAAAVDTSHATEHRFERAQATFAHRT